MAKRKVGYTTGVFDLFHIGHLNILKRAKQHCDYLIVGVTTDEEAKRIKNKVPVICFEERKQIVESIRYVDLVVPEDNEDKKIAWEKLKFDVIFKGSDWQGSKKWNDYESFFKPRGVEVVYFPYTEGTSSTMLREVLHKIINREETNVRR
ncbi:MAG TPA: adenylyltransferase/cytidyltransferase family protein [Clostridiaceae bacterium]|nr:adenylyltransferase/cytidyltransferase family protein [Clostridiaceae bacterium]